MKKLTGTAVLSAAILIAQLFLPAGHACAQVLTYDLNAGLAGHFWEFSYVQLSDIHIGYGTTDYASPGYDDALAGASEGAPEANLRRAVEYINARRDEFKIRFVVLTGDITHHAQRSEFLKAREILRGLSVPYVPVIGNHDVWPFSADGEAAPAPIGGRYFREVFAEEFSKLAAFFPGWEDASGGVQNTATGTIAGYYLQNYAFRYGGYSFVVPDLIGRDRKPVKGSPVSVDLYNAPGGTWGWLSRYYSSSAAPEKHLVVLSHYPLTDEKFQGERLFQAEYEMAAKLLASRGQAGLWNSGHLHRNREYQISSGGRKVAPVVETASNRAAMTLRIIRVWDIPAPARS